MLLKQKKEIFLNDFGKCTENLLKKEKKKKTHKEVKYIYKDRITFIIKKTHIGVFYHL